MKEIDQLSGKIEERKHITLEQMLAECDINAPMPTDLVEWIKEDIPVGRELH